MISCDRQELIKLIQGKSVAIVGSGPGVMLNEPGYIDSFDTVIRINNFRIYPETGYRTDIFFSFFGKSIKKSIEDLDGVKLCWCKCPNAQPIQSEWHRLNDKMNGVDFRYIYENRADWWPCPVYVPSVHEFMQNFHLLGQHIPTTGFSAIIDVLRHGPKSLFLTGFDFFSSKLHNVNEPWKIKNTTDPICHVPHEERRWLAENLDRFPITCDETLAKCLAIEVAA